MGWVVDGNRSRAAGFLMYLLPMDDWFGAGGEVMTPPQAIPQPFVQEQIELPFVAEYPGRGHAIHMVHRGLMTSKTHGFSQHGVVIETKQQAWFGALFDIVGHKVQCSEFIAVDAAQMQAQVIVAVRNGLFAPPVSGNQPAGQDVIFLIEHHQRCKAEFARREGLLMHDGVHHDGCDYSTTSTLLAHRGPARLVQWLAEKTAGRRGMKENIMTCRTTPYDDQRPGTSGLRKPVSRFLEPNYLENFLQAIFNAAHEELQGKTLVLGGDGRFHNDVALGVCLRMAAANGVARVLLGQHGLLSTPAGSHLIRHHGAGGGILLTASHNPGGAHGDFGIKFNTSNGAPAPEALTEAIYGASRQLQEYRIYDAPIPDLGTLGQSAMGDMIIEIIDPVAAYADLLSRLIDFEAIAALFQSGFRMIFDAMHAVTGPYAREILENRLGAPAGTVINHIPLPDFGGGHPDPNPHNALELMHAMGIGNGAGRDSPHFGAASDGDGDRNMILGPATIVSPCDSLALLTAHAHLIPQFAAGVRGVGRSMPTSHAVDRVAQALGIPVYETATGWKYFCNLLDADLISLCGEESYGSGGNHIREKDGLWAVLCWLNILAATRLTLPQLLTRHWAQYGRDLFQRHDYEGLDSSAADGLMQHLRQRLASLPGSTWGALTIAKASEFRYRDPVDGSISTPQGIELHFQQGGRAVFRLSGTGTQGATLRLYVERPLSAQDALQTTDLTPWVEAAHQVADLAGHLGRTAADVVV